MNEVWKLARLHSETFPSYFEVRIKSNKKQGKFEKRDIQCMFIRYIRSRAIKTTRYYNISKFFEFTGKRITVAQLYPQNQIHPK